jgi:hypothetical protein
LRVYNHVLTASKSGKSVIFQINVDDRFGKQIINHSSVTGWRCKIALKNLVFNSEDWDDDVTRKFIGLKVLKAAKTKYEALQFIEEVRSHSSMEVHFWAYKFLTNEKAIKSWKALYF